MTLPSQSDGFCTCVYQAHCHPGKPGRCKLKAGGTTNGGGGVCRPKGKPDGGDPLRLLLQLWADPSVRAAVGEGSDLYGRVQTTIDSAMEGR